MCLAFMEQVEKQWKKCKWEILEQIGHQGNENEMGQKDEGKSREDGVTLTYFIESIVLCRLLRERHQ